MLVLNKTSHLIQLKIRQNKIYLCRCMLYHFNQSEIAALAKRLI